MKGADPDYFRSVSTPKINAIHSHENGHLLPDETLQTSRSVFIIVAEHGILLGIFTYHVFHYLIAFGNRHGYACLGVGLNSPK